MNRDEEWKLDGLCNEIGGEAMRKREEFMYDLRRFWSKVDKSDECWLWRGQVNNMGYGRFTFWRGSGRQRVFAHRLSLELSGVKVPDDEVIRHTCDTPRCVRPDHLTLGTQLENIHDAIARGRLDTSGLSSTFQFNCATCGKPFWGKPSRRYCDEHSRWIQKKARGEVA